jgi:hypothetical protein
MRSRMILPSRRGLGAYCLKAHRTNLRATVVLLRYSLAAIPRLRGGAFERPAGEAFPGVGHECGIVLLYS